MFFAPTFGLVYVYCVDLFPTIVRNLCVGLCVTVCRMGSVLAPQLILLGVYTSPDVPILISGIIMLMAAVVIYFMP
ncbi:organic cation/carnitine transporter 2-like [Hydractinia symbiolongicarpus]|uniref:organic cation/carnitine transporter 2-like n=1 Tax=Hydractinia symbiolongicarpus TaxID=13093 RepID=UPI0025505205|nr:organic cation/carnitine transporter 2-like [Hydractinia symbiolongicarpus]